tara:strand:- start:1109 stop:2005 length:897 start_codon:yes stop_codon:yes gene_type:complete
MNRTIVVRLKGGIGNQLFTYSAAKRLAMVNKAQLLIDSKTGFINDIKYNRSFLLDSLIPDLKIIKINSIFLALIKVRNQILRCINYFIPFNYRNYLFQEKIEFDSRLLSYRFSGKIFFEGYWQSELYFSDIKTIIRSGVRLPLPDQPENKSYFDSIQRNESVAVHIRMFSQENNFSTSTQGINYYCKAIALIESRIIDPHYFVFSDDIIPKNILTLFPSSRCTILSDNLKSRDAIYDFSLMARCKHFIIANSTFSWWGAWLSKYEKKIVIYPNITIIKNEGCWGFEGLFPIEWQGIKS